MSPSIQLTEIHGVLPNRRLKLAHLDEMKARTAFLHCAVSTVALASADSYHANRFELSRSTRRRYELDVSRVDHSELNARFNGPNRGGTA